MGVVHHILFLVKHITQKLTLRLWVASGDAVTHRELDLLLVKRFVKKNNNE
jgi:hypothetical protein